MLNAFFVALAVFVGVGGHELFGMVMLSRPIVVAPLTGLLLGDVQTGLLVGASLESIFMGVVNVGISSTAEPALAAGLATAFTIQMGGNVGTIIPIVFPLAVLGLQFMNFIFSFVIGPFAPKFEQLALEGKDKSITALHFGLWVLHYALIPFFAVWLGSDVVQTILQSIPKVIMNGLTVAGNMLPAVGMAMLMQMLWDKKTGIYYILGFVAVAYLKLPLIAIAVLGVVIALVTAQRDMQLKDMMAKPAVASASANDSEEEDFFAIRKMFWRSGAMYASVNPVTMGGAGFCYAMIPFINHFYKNDEKKRREALARHVSYFSTTVPLASFVMGIAGSMEKENSEKPDFDANAIGSIKTSLMGPLAGIGDSLVVGTVIPILLGIALGFAEGGSPLGPLFYIIVWNATSIWFQKFVYFKGYELGGSAVELLVGQKATAFRESVLVMGQVIVGAMAASWVSISTNLVIAQSYDAETGKLTDVTLGSKLDGAFPKILTMLFVLFAWWLMAKKNITPIKVLLLFVVIGFVGSVVGFLG